MAIIAGLCLGFAIAGSTGLGVSDAGFWVCALVGWFGVCLIRARGENR